MPHDRGSPRILIATCAELPDLHEQDRVLLEAFSGLGAVASPAVWDDPGVAWGGADAVLIRSTWDYTDAREAFLAWAERIPHLINSPAVMRWNTDKHYLMELERAAIPIVPTVILDPGDEVRVPGGEVVVKPAISAGSRDTARYAPGARDRAAAHARRLLAQGRSVLIQPYLAEIDAEGETGVVVIGGVVSHAIRKAPLLKPGQPPDPAGIHGEQIETRTPTAAEAALADLVLDRMGSPPVYARVDMVGGRRGTPCLMELELVEPALFLSLAPGAADRLAAAVLHHLGERRGM